MNDDENTSLTFRSIATLIAVISIAVVVGRICSAESKDRKTPFFSANDRSRWCMISALVDHGTYSIDDVIKRPGWNTIDKVRHLDRDGELRHYSSKPPLYPTLLAAKYWIVKKSHRRVARERAVLRRASDAGNLQRSTADRFLLLSDKTRRRVFRIGMDESFRVGLPPRSARCSQRSPFR